MSKIMTPEDERRVYKFVYDVFRRSSKQELLDLFINETSMEQKRVIIHKLFPRWSGDTADLAFLALPFPI